MKDYKLYIFDFDLTLADTRRAITTCFRGILDRRNITDITDEFIVSTIGMSLGNAFSLMLGENDPEKLKQLDDEFTQYAEEHMTAMTELFDATIPVLKALKEKGARTAIVSSKKRMRIQESIDKFDMNDLIDIVIGAEDINSFKPDPEGINKVIAYFGEDKGDCLYVGDTTIDANAAVNAGLDFAAVTTGSTPTEAFDELPHVKIMKNLYGLL